MPWLAMAPAGAGVLNLGVIWSMRLRCTPINRRTTLLVQSQASSTRPDGRAAAYACVLASSYSHMNLPACVHVTGLITVWVASSRARMQRICTRTAATCRRVRPWAASDLAAGRALIGATVPLEADARTPSCPSCRALCMGRGSKTMDANAIAIMHAHRTPQKKRYYLLTN